MQKLCFKLDNDKGDVLLVLTNFLTYEFKNLLKLDQFCDYKKSVMEREVLTITEMYQNNRISVKIDGGQSKEFELNRTQFLALYSYAVVMNEAIKNVKEFLYADDLVGLGDSWEKAEMRYVQSKNAIMEKGLKVNVKKTKV